MPRPSLGTRKQVSIRFTESLLAEVDQARGRTPRDQWVERACRLALAPIIIERAIGPVAHYCEFTIPHTTEYKAGVRTTTKACKCGKTAVM